MQSLGFPKIVYCPGVVVDVNGSGCHCVVLGLSAPVVASVSVVTIAVFVYVCLFVGSCCFLTTGFYKKIIVYYTFSGSCVRLRWPENRA